MSGKRGPKKGEKVRKNPDAKSLAPTSKFVTGIDILEHMGLLRRLQRDHLATLANSVKHLRKKMGLVPLPPVEESAHAAQLKTEGESLAYLPGDLLITLDDVIVALRIYGKGAPPAKLAVSEGKEWVEHNAALIEARSTYREIATKKGGGQIVTFNCVYGTRKVTGKNGEIMKDANRRSPGKLERKGSSPLRTIVVRLMPHEARAVGEAGFAGQLTDDQLARAIDRTVEDFEKVLGCEVVSAAVHRMRNTDLHLHIQYTMVLPVDRDEKLLKQAIAAWDTEATKAATASLVAENGSLAPAAVGKRKKMMIEKGLIRPEPDSVELDQPLIFQKINGGRSLTNDTILGYSLKFKLNLVRVLETARRRPGESEESKQALDKLRQQVVDRNDVNENFRFKARRSDKSLEEEYLDVWLEREWRRNVVAELPDLYREMLISAGVEDARKYAEEGSTRAAGQSIFYRHNQDVATQLKAAEGKIEETQREIERIEQMVADELARIQTLAEEVETKRADVLGEMESAWKSVAGPEEVSGISPADRAVVGQVPESTVSGWMALIRQTLAKKDKALEKEAEGRADVTAWKKVLRLLGAKVPDGAIPAEMKIVGGNALTQRIAQGIADGVAAGMASVFRLLGSEIPSGQDVNQALTVAKENYESASRVESLRNTLGVVRGGRTPEIGRMEEDALQVEIIKESERFHDGVAAQTREALVGLTRFVFGKNLANYLIGKNSGEADLKSELKKEFHRRGEAELHLEKALPILAKHAPDLAKEARGIIEARPKMPVLAKKAAKKVLGKSADKKGPQIGG